jgi:hypothetical protein
MAVIIVQRGIQRIEAKEQLKNPCEEYHDICHLDKEV